MVYDGISCSNGIAIGKAYKYGKAKPYIDRRCIQAAEIDEEIKKLAQSIELAKNQLADIKAKAIYAIGKETAEILDTHIAILNDPVIAAEIEDFITLEKVNVAAAVETVFKKYKEGFLCIKDEYFRERAADVEDVEERLLRNITGMGMEDLAGYNEQFIIVAEEIIPSDIALLIKKNVKGIVAEKGSKASHAAIMARALRIPAVFGLGAAVKHIANNTDIIIDGGSGKVITSPDEGQIAEYRHMSDCYNVFAAKDYNLAYLPATTKDDRCVKLYANINNPEDIDDIAAYGVEGVGLYRSEFLCNTYGRLPDEQEQFQAYKTIVDGLFGKPLVIRTLDLGGDKSIPCLALPDETNLFMGWRSIRISLESRSIFKTQLRAILRAGAYGNISLMYPMISCVSEIREANSILEEAKNELFSEGIEFNSAIKTGIVVEVPSAAIMIDLIAKEVDFLSIGTNDLCQFVLAVDRTNPKVARLYQPLHPAVLILIGNIIAAAHKNGIPVAMCGEMASDPAAAFILLGLGLDEFSMNASSIPGVRNIIRSISFERAKEAAGHVLQLSTAAEVSEYVGVILNLIDF